MAFTTTASAAGVSLIGTSGVDVASFTPTDLVASIYVGAQADNDTVEITGAAAENLEANLGEGADTYVSEGLTDSTVRGNDGADSITDIGTVDTSWINGNAGDDVITVDVIVDSTISGGQGEDTFSNTGTITDTLINGNKDDDNITLGAFDTDGATLRGGEGDDTINALDGTDNGVTIFGDDGNDDLTGTAAFGDTLTGGSGVDEFTLASAAAVNDAVTATSVDVVTDFVAGRGGDIASLTPAFDFTNVTEIFNFTLVGGGDSFFAVGRYVSGTFTIGAGNDVIVGVGTGAPLAQLDNSAIFTGYNSFDDFVATIFA